MKRIILILVLLASLKGFGQAYQQNGTFGINFKRIATESGLTAPKGDTSLNNSLSRGGGLVFKSSNKRFYFHDSTKWKLLLDEDDVVGFDNFANADLTFDNERIHTINGWDLTVQNSLAAKGGYFKLFSGGAGIYGAKNSSNLFTGLQANATQSLALMTNDNDRLTIASNGRVKFNNYNLSDSVLTTDGSGNLVGALRMKYSDTTSLSNRIDLKLNASDSSKYLKLDGSTTMTGNLVFSGNAVIKSNTFQSGLVDYTLLNTGLGYKTLLTNTTGAYNVAIGDSSLFASNSNHLTAVGHRTLSKNTSGIGNTAVGSLALVNNTTADYNSAFGYSSLQANTTGYDNSAFGYANLASNTTGYYNTGVGKAALNLNTSGYNNSAFGVDALAFNTTGFNNNAFGIDALYQNTTGFYNSAFGSNGLVNTTTGYENSTFGYSSSLTNITGFRNSSFGALSLYNNTGNYNSAFGHNAGRTITTGVNNTFLGVDAGYNASQKVDATNSTAIGNGAYTTANNQMVFGNSSVTENLFTGKVGIGVTPNFTIDVGEGAIKGATLNLGLTGADYYWRITTNYGVSGNIVLQDNNSNIPLNITNTTGRVAIGNGYTAANASAILDLTSTTLGFLPPRMTTTQKNALTAVEGLIVYDLTLHQFSYYNGSSWTNL